MRLLTLLAGLALWAGLVGYAISHDWLRAPLAPRGDAAGFGRAIETTLAEEGFAGNLSYLLIERGQTAAQGILSPDGTLTPDSPFQAASLSKWVAAWGVLALADQGLVDLDAPVETYLTRWTLPEGEFDSDGVTLRRLLSHTAGLGDGLGYDGFADPAEMQGIEASLTLAADATEGATGAVAITHEPGDRWRYSGGGYTLIQLVIEEVTGRDFAAYMAASVLGPLGMDHSAFALSETQAAALPTFHDGEGGAAPRYHYTALAAAGLYTTPADLARFMAAHLPGPSGDPAGRGVLSPGTIDAMQTPHARLFTQPIWGLGVILYARAGGGAWIFGHDGQNRPAINATARLDPTTGDGVVIMSSGASALASQFGAEWVYWQTGRVDAVSLSAALPAGLLLVVAGWIVILALWILRPWRKRKQA